MAATVSHARARREHDERSDEQPDKGEVDKKQRQLAGQKASELVELTDPLDQGAAGRPLEGAIGQLEEPVHDLATDRHVEARSRVAGDMTA